MNKRKANELNGATQYKWKLLEDKSRDIAIYEITRSTDKIPHTILLHQYSKCGPQQLFSDLFFSDDWDECRGKDGNVSDDVKFCIELWKLLGCEESTGESFQPKHIIHEMNRYPTVYRNTAENIMNIKYGCHSIEIHDEIDTTLPEKNKLVIPLTFDCTESDEEITNKIQLAMEVELLKTARKLNNID